MSNPSAKEYAQALYDQLLETPVKKRDRFVSDFVITVNQHGQSNISDDIIKKFQDLATQKENTIEIVLVSSMPLHNLVYLSHKISNEIKKNIELKNLINSDLIGGVVLYYKDYKIDFSLKKIISQSFGTKINDFVCMDDDLKTIINIINQDKDLLFEEEKIISKSPDIEIVNFTSKDKPVITVLERQLSAVMLKKVIINFNKDPNIIAGAIIEYDHNKINTTVSNKIENK